MRDLDLKHRLQLAGLTVTEIDGWQTRGKDTLNAHGSVNHHTAGPRTGNSPSLGTVINGRPDLPGPLCNVHGPREETLRVNLVAAGKANHAGVGHWLGLEGNSTVLGLEEEHSGTAQEPLSPLRYDRMVRVHAAFAYGRFSADYVCQHWEWATPPGRKVDFARAWVDPVKFRADVDVRLRLMALPPANHKEDFFMALSDTEQHELLDRIRHLTPFPPEKITRSGKITKDGTAADPSVRWTIETTNGIRALLTRNPAGLDPKELAALIVEGMPDDLAEATADVLAKRLAG